MTEKQPNLTKLIITDLFKVGFIPLILLIAIFAAAMGIVFSTHNTRSAITEKDQTLVERERLDSEWRNLILEEKALAEHSRVQKMAVDELQMQRPDGDKEVVIASP